MVRIIGIHPIELREGVKAEDLESFCKDALLPAISAMPGTTTRLFKGDKGARDGKYLLLWEFGGPEERAQFFVDEAEASDAVKQVWKQWEKLRTLVTNDFSDYVELPA